MKKIILATNNSGKIKEIQAILSTIECIPQFELGINEVEETGLSFVENSIIKARNACLIGNYPALADDSGLVVPDLQGEPGIYSARYAGKDATSKDNINLLLKNLQKINNGAKDPAFAAFFYCTIVVLQHAKDPTPIITTGKIWGKIISTPVGDNGFGYDPIFYLPQYGCTMAQISNEEKNKISHRAIAINKLKNQL